MRQVFWLNTKRTDHAGFSFSLFGNCMIVPKTHTHIYFLKIIVLFKLDKENPIQFCFQNQNISLFVFIFIEFQG